MSDVERTVKDALAALDLEERQLTESLQNIEIRLSRVRAARATLAALDSGEPVEFEGKLADAIRTVLMAKRASHSPIEIRNLVKQLGYVFPEGSNQMAAVHGVIKRLLESGMVKPKEWPKQPGITRYYWHTFALSRLMKAQPKRGK